MTVEQTSVESIFHEMGYASSTDYAIKKAREELLRELKVSLGRIDAFEKKYEMTYAEFDKQFHSLTQFSLFERDDDSMDWRAELTVLRSIEKRLATLTL
ncbi:hypothetical protein GGR92_003587 [Spirosoma lacussanchae]|uniref:hypothetical protein n=1 Tax=Spirosoma lacussanchae TaxID=1884249 RepID=UPI0011093C7E|nr:hypothetical protein [Spirosoma lacussanchae]